MPAEILAVAAGRGSSGKLSVAAGAWLGNVLCAGRFHSARGGLKDLPARSCAERTIRWRESGEHRSADLHKPRGRPVPDRRGAREEGESLDLGAPGCRTHCSATVPRTAGRKACRSAQDYAARIALASVHRRGGRAGKGKVCRQSASCMASAGGAPRGSGVHRCVPGKAPGYAIRQKALEIFRHAS